MIFIINCLKIYIKENNLKWQFNITPWFVLNIDEFSWCYALYVTWFFRYITWSYIVALNYMFIIKVANIMINWFVLFLIFASSNIIYNKSPRCFHNFLLSVIWSERIVFLYQKFFLPWMILKRSLVHVNFIILYLGKNISLYSFFLWYLRKIHNDVVKHQTTRHKTLGIIIAYVLIFDWKNTLFRANFQWY